MLGFGRTLFWFFIGAVGFLAGLTAGTILLSEYAVWITVFAAFGCGILGIVLAVVLQRAAFALAGFYAAGYLVFVMTRSLPETTSLALALAGGVVGALLVAVLTDRGIIVVSSLAGSGAVVAGLAWDGIAAVAAFVGLAASGILFQMWSMARSARA